MIQDQNLVIQTMEKKQQKDDDQVKKFLTLVKQAQNEALIQLIADGLKSELQNQKLRVTQVITDFLKRELVRGDLSEFTRLKVSEGLLPILSGLDVSQELFESKLNTEGSTYEKQIERLSRSVLVQRADSCSLCQIELETIATPQFLQKLIQEYQPLLASQEVDVKEEPDQVKAQQNTKHRLKSELMGELENVRSIKLSDFIDEKFLDQLDSEAIPPVSQIPQKLRVPIADLITLLEKSATRLFEHHTLKRQKNDSNVAVEFIIFSPHLAISVYQIEQLLSQDYKRRQAAICQLRYIMAESDSFQYSTVSSVNKQSFTLQSGLFLSKQQMAQVILPRLLICMLKDNFSDFEGLKVLAPVREEALKLLSTIMPLLGNEIQMKLLAMLPNIFREVERDVWHSKLNFFLILKGMVLKSDKSLKEQVLKIFGQLLIVAIPNVEDEPKVAITELLQILLPVYLSSFNSPKIPTKTLTLLLDNLTLNLQKADEIEASAIAVFNLVCKVFELRSQFKCLADFKYSLNLNIFAPFNYHKLEPVRRSYNALILEVLSSGSMIGKEDLRLLLTLTVQSIAMESGGELLEILYTLLEKIVQLMPMEEFKLYLEEYLMQNERLPEWMTCVQPDFKSFKFVESAGFQSLQNDYFQVVFRPANDAEWEAFFNQKVKRLTKALAVMLHQGKATNYLFDAACRRTQVVDQQVGDQIQVRTVLNQSMLQLMIALEQYIRFFGQKLPTEDSNIEVIDFEYLQGLASQLLNSDELDVSLNDCWDAQQLLNSLAEFATIAESLGQNYLVDLAKFAQSCVSEFIVQQIFRSVQEPDFNGLVNQISQLTAQLNNQQMSQAFVKFFNIYQNTLLYVQSYNNRLKSASAGILLGIARLHQDVTDENQTAKYLTSILNTVTKPLLVQLNGEHVSVYRNLACLTVVDLLILLDRLKLWTPLKLVLNLIIQMIQEGFDGTTQHRDESVALVMKTLCATSENFYIQFRGSLGASVLKPQLFRDETDVRQWLRLAFVITDAQRNSKLGSEFQIKSYALICKLIENALVTGECDLLPKFVDSIFYDLTSELQSVLLNTLVQKMQEHHKVAFDCLEMLLDSQIKNQREHGFINYLPIFVLPVIKNLQLQGTIYSNGDFRIMKILAKLIQILPLNLAALAQNNVSEMMSAQMKEGLDFLKVFAANEIVEKYEILIPVAAKFRTYQLEGINWMAKLGSFNLNCALCDDMGLGKTLQSLTVVLNESAKRKGKSVNLVICPTSLTYNWLSEIKKFFGGVKAEVIEKSNQVLNTNSEILIINYEKVKSNLMQLESIPFFYIVLDEAHKIKNSKSVITQSVNRLKCERKLALSGTPLQNRVSELWSLFDFLMPNFLEDETTFNKTYNKYLTGNIKKMQEKLEETQQFVNALKSLKRRIAPFILRRTKEQVLKELPPKVIQDYECIMPPHQYSVHQIIEKEIPFSSVIGKQTNSLQTLIIHRKVCNHPILVDGLVEGLPTLQHGYQHSAKMIGLLEILQECEILQQKTGEDENLFTSTTQPHRALIFFQMQSFLKLVEKEVIQQFGVKYLQLTGSMSSKERVETVDLFNSNQSYKVLLLTTAVGGLGLTLTGADMVIFLEHDWNPMKDLQAMDRAHRIGQTRTVNVYRLIVKDTIEEKIMSLQRFKENLAKSLIQNRGDGENELIDEKQMDLSDLLKSFEEHSIYQKQTAAPNNKDKKEKKALTLAQVIAAEGIDQELATIQKTWQGADFEKL